MYNRFLLFVTLFVLICSTAFAQSNTAVVLAMHGGVPNDFPKDELMKFFKMHGKDHSGDAEMQKKAHELEEKLRNWPRSEENDPYYWGSLQLRNAMEKDLNIPVVLAFNEFCGPSIETAIAEMAANKEIEKIFVVTAMLTQGGSHSEKDIPAAIERARKDIERNDIAVEYVWPINVDATAAFLSSQITPELAKE